jgi:hypothetical protein
MVSQEEIKNSSGGEGRSDLRRLTVLPRQLSQDNREGQNPEPRQFQCTKGASHFIFVYPIAPRDSYRDAPGSATDKAILAQQVAAREMN